MIHIIKGDLLLAEDINVIGHQANCQITMGAGIAKQIKKRFPEAYEADKNFPYPKGKERLGKCSYGISKEYKKIIFNLYGQDRYGKFRVQSDYEKSHQALKDALIQMFEEVNKLEKKYKKFKAKIGFPYLMGCYLGGGNWKIVYQILEDVSNMYQRDIYLYQLT